MKCFRVNLRSVVGQALSDCARPCQAKPDLLASLHHDQDGTISIVAIFAVLLLTILLGMVMNVGRQVDGKIRMQNAADAAAYSGGVVLARGMNTLTFTNHLLCDVFALTAYMREARNRNSEQCSGPVLDAWDNVAPLFQKSSIPKFSQLGSAISQKVPLERELVRSYSQWAAAVSSEVLPLLETILSEELIPQYQRAVVEAFPDIAQQAAMETAHRNGDPDRGRGPMLGVLWRTSGEVVGAGDETMNRTLPVVDPVLDMLLDQADYMKAARDQRKRLSHIYLDQWNSEAMSFFDSQGKMSQFAAFWRSFTCGYLEKLLNEEYPDRNLLFQIRSEHLTPGTAGEYIERDFTYLSVVYWRRLPDMFKKVFRNPMDNDCQAYAAVRLYIPRNRLVWSHTGGAFDTGPPRIGVGGVPGDFPPMYGQDSDYTGQQRNPGSPERWMVVRQGLPTDWDLLNQSWTCQLVPATQQCLPTVLQTPPPVPEFDAQSLKLPSLGGVTSEDIQRISPH